MKRNLPKRETRFVRPAFLLMLLFSTLISSVTVAQKNNFETGSLSPDINPGRAFAENLGQILDQNGNPNSSVLFLYNGAGMNVQLRRDGFSYDTWVPVFEEHAAATRNSGSSVADSIFSRKTVKEFKLHRIDINLPGINPNVQTEGVDPQDISCNFVNSERGSGVTVRHFRKVIYRNAYPNIDIEFTIKDSGDIPVEYNFIIRPGGDAKQILLEYRGADRVELQDGKIVMAVAHGKVEENIPMSWLDDQAEEVMIRYASLGDNTFGFSIPSYDKSRTLTIDPTPRLIWGTFIQEPVNTFMDVYSPNFSGMDQEGNLYLVATTKYPGFATSGAFQSVVNGETDIVLFKLDKKGKMKVATYFGGNKSEWRPTIHVDALGVYVASYTNSNNMATMGAARRDIDFLIARFDFNLQRVWSQYVGGTGNEGNSQINNPYDRPIVITTDPSGNIIFAGVSKVNNFPFAGSVINNTTTVWKVVGAKFDISGNAVWSGTLIESAVNTSNFIDFWPDALTTDNQNNIYLLCGKGGDNAPFAGVSTPGVLQTQVSGGTGAFMVKFNTSGIKQWGTWIGGNDFVFTGQAELGPRIQVDPGGKIWLAFYTSLQDTLRWMPTADAYIQSNPFTPDNENLIQICQISNDAKQLLYSTMYYPSSVEYAWPWGMDFKYDPAGDDVYLAIAYLPSPITVRTLEESTTPCAHIGGPYRNRMGGTHLCKLGNGGRIREWSTWYGGGGGGNAQTTNVGLQLQNDRIVLAMGVLEEAVNSSNWADVTTPGTYQPVSYNTRGFLIGNFDEGILPDSIESSANQLSPLLMTSCAGGLVSEITGTKVVITGPLDYSNAVLYQWQRATNINGPWQDIPGATTKNYNPEAEATGIYYFRRQALVPAPGCDKVELSVSDIVTLTVSTNAAPLADAGGTKYYTCYGNSVTLNGSATGGSGAPYSYAWYIGSSTVVADTTPDLTNTPLESTIYTLRITDSAGCFGIDQVSVEPVKANAGTDRPFCQGSDGVQLGLDPIQGASEVGYAWTPAGGLSCTTCPQPVAVPLNTITYTLTVSVTEKSGNVCTLTDDITVTPVALPNGIDEFAGPDKTVCQGDITTLGLPGASGYNYTWAPGSYIVNNQIAQTTYDAGINVVNVPLTYSLTAEKNGCVFVDWVDVYTIYFQVTPRNDIWCDSPRWISQEADAGEVNSPEAVYTWEKVSGDAQFYVASTRNNGADAILRIVPGSGNSVTFRRKTTLNGVSCYSFLNTINICSGGGGGCGSDCEIRVTGGSGCPLPGGNYWVYAKYIDQDDYYFKWSPSWAFDNDTLPVPKLIVPGALTITVLATNKSDSNCVAADTLFVNDPALSLPVFAVSDTFQCPGQTINIGRPFVQGYAYLWNNTEGMANPAVDKLVSDPAVTLQNSATYVVRVEDVGTGCYILDTMNVVVPLVFGDAGPDRTVCAGAVVGIGQPVDSGNIFSFSWSPSNSPWQNGTNQFDANPDLLFAGSDLRLILTVTEPNYNCQYKDTVDLMSTSGTPLPNLTAPAPVCPGLSVQLGDNGVTGATYSWSPATGLSCTDCPNPVASPSVTTTYTVTVSDCGPPVTGSVTVTVLPSPPFVLSNREVCPSAPINIGLGASGNTGSLPDVQSYSWTPSGGLSCTTCANPLAGPSQQTTYKLVVTYNNGCKSVRSCTVTPEPGTEAVAGPDVSICPGENYMLGKDPVPGSTYSWSPSSGLNNPNIANPVATPSSTTTYTLTVTRNGCTATDQVNVVVKAPPPFTIGGISTICKGGETTLGFPGEINMIYQWSPLEGVVSPNNPQSVFTTKETTKYRLTQTSLLTGCSNYREITVVVNDPEFGINASTSSPLKVCAGTSITLPLEVTPAGGNYVYSWTPSGSLNGPFDQNPLAIPVSSTVYRVRVTNLANNCILPATVPVQVVPLSECSGDDYGDVPYSYEKGNPAHHKLIGGFRIGNYADNEVSPQSVYQGAPSTGDDTNKQDDEDAVSGIVNVHRSVDYYGITVNKIQNDTFNLAYLAGWLDINRDGCFDDDERSIIQPVGKDPGVYQSFALDWSGFNPDGYLPFGKTYLRIRYTADGSLNWPSDPSPTGYRSSGEVEDYCLYVYPSLPYPDSKVADLGDTVSGDLSANDDMPPGTRYLPAIAVPGNPSSSVPVVGQTGFFTFTASIPGVFNFIVPVFDGIDTFDVKLTIRILNQLAPNSPVASTDVAITFMDEAVTINTLSNDFAGSVNKLLDPTSILVVTQPGHGTAFVDSITGNITYIPDAGYVGPDSYIYTVNDNSSPVLAGSACQFIQVIPANCANSVLAANDQKCTVSGSTNTGNVLDNDMDPEGHGISAIPMSITTADYSFSLAADGSYVFTPNFNFTEPVVFLYVVKDDNIPAAFDTAMLCFYLKTVIGDRVWLDKDRDGFQDSTEMGISGVSASLYTCTNGVPGLPLQGFNAISGENGQYFLPVPPNGSYAMYFDYSGIPGNSGLRWTIPNIELNTLDNQDSDVAMNSGFTGCFDVTNTSAGNVTLDAGLFPDADGDYIADCFDSNPDTANIDPMGHIYCENTGEILDGGFVSASGPGNVYMIRNGSDGVYLFLVDATGTYTITVNNPAGFLTSTACVAQSSVLITSSDTITLGAGDTDMNDRLDDRSCTANPFHYSMLLTPGSFVLNNNFPMQCLDLGDLPDSYPTLLSGNGPSHGILQTPTVFLGGLVDMETDGQPNIMAGMMGGGDDGTVPASDDEDGLATIPTIVITVPTSFQVQVVNNTSVSAKVAGFIDFNNDKDFNDAGEIQMTNVAAGYSGPATLTFTAPVTSAVGMKVGIRFRITTDLSVGATGFANDGEIEDYMAIIAGFDYGDLPDTYNTNGGDNPPAHVVSPLLKLGASVDAEIDGNPDPMAGSMGAGDDGDVGPVY